MKYQIEAPEGDWTRKIVVEHLGGDAYLTLKLTQANSYTPVVVESAELEYRSRTQNHRVPVDLRDVEVITRRNKKPSYHF